MVLFAISCVLFYMHITLSMSHPLTQIFGSVL